MQSFEKILSFLLKSNYRKTARLREFEFVSPLMHITQVHFPTHFLLRQVAAIHSNRLLHMQTELDDRLLIEVVGKIARE